MQNTTVIQGAFAPNRSAGTRSARSQDPGPGRSCHHDHTGMPVPTPPGPVEMTLFDVFWLDPRKPAKNKRSLKPAWKTRIWGPKPARSGGPGCHEMHACGGHGGSFTGSGTTYKTSDTGPQDSDCILLQKSTKNRSKTLFSAVPGRIRLGSGAGLPERQKWPKVTKSAIFRSRHVWPEHQSNHTVIWRYWPFCS